MRLSLISCAFLFVFSQVFAGTLHAQNDITVYGTNVKRQAFAEVFGDVTDPQDIVHGFSSPTIRKPGPGDEDYDTSQADGDLIAQTGIRSVKVATCEMKGSALGSAKVTKGVLSESGAFFYINGNIPLANYSGSLQAFGHAEVHQDFVATSVSFDEIQHEFKATFDLSLPHPNLSWSENQHVHIDEYNNAVATYEPANTRWHIVGTQTLESGTTFPINDYVTGSGQHAYTFFKVADSLEPVPTYTKYNQAWTHNGASLFLTQGGSLFQMPGASVKLEHIDAVGFSDD